ncbi:MAG: hypothetical protein F4X27_06785 [Chloroflexi bacterium]|nr:hypothetical protein [Chloroflexota bacterium]
MLREANEVGGDVGVDLWLEWMIGLVGPQVPKDTTGLVYLFIWSAVFEPLKTTVLRRYPLLPVTMVGAGYALLLCVLSTAQSHLEDASNGKLLPAQLLIIFALWLIVSGLVSAVLFAPRVYQGWLKVREVKCGRAAAMVVFLATALTLLLARDLLGEESLVFAIAVSLLTGILMMLAIIVVVMVIGHSVIACRNVGKACLSWLGGRLCNWWRWFRGRMYGLLSRR